MENNNRPNFDNFEDLFQKNDQETGNSDNFDNINADESRKDKSYLDNDFFFDDSPEKNITQKISKEDSSVFGRTIDNTGYIMYGKDSDTNNTGTDFSTREMASYSNTENTSTVPALKNVKKSADLEKKEEKRRNKKKRKKNRRVFRVVWICLVLILGIFLGGYLSKGASDVFAMKRQTETTAQINIPEGATPSEVGKILKDSGVIFESDFFSLYCKVTKVSSFERGEFNIPTNMDYEEIINYLQSNNNRLDVVEIMFREGMNILEVAQLLSENEVADYDEVLTAANSTDFDKYDIIAPINKEGKYYKIEGYLFPDTYQFYKGEGAVSALSRLIYNGQKKIMTVENQAILTEKGMTYDELIIIASLIQSEAGNASEMADISSVIQNRLNDGYLYDIYTLGIDASTYYPYRTAADVPSDLSNYKSNYDTTTINGLPAGAICNPGTNAIEAALNPSSTDYYYYIHGEDGVAYFASTYEEHQQNIEEHGLSVD